MKAQFSINRMLGEWHDRHKDVQGGLAATFCCGVLEMQYEIFARK
jgi:hypothetical protein